VVDDLGKAIAAESGWNEEGSGGGDGDVGVPGGEFDLDLLVGLLWGSRVEGHWYNWVM